MDTPNERSAHDFNIPTYGGVAIFIAFAVVFMIGAMAAQLSSEVMGKSMLLLASTTLLFFLGIKDDLIGLRPKKKFLAQFLVAGLIIFLGDVRIDSMGGIFGINQLSYGVSTLFSLFVFLLMGNAFNLIDGIDGLAGGISTLAGLFLGICFLWENQIALALPAFILSGASLGFLRFNLSKKRRLFMGDSGSLFIGFLLGYLGIAFLQEVGSTGTIAKAHPPVILLAVLSYPLLDTLRVFVIRIGNRRSPFSADKNHLHHRLLQKGFTHAQATMLIILANIAVIGLCWGSQTLSVTAQCFFVVGLGSLVYLAPIILLPSVNQEMRRKTMVDNFETLELDSQSELSNREVFRFQRLQKTFKNYSKEELRKIFNNPDQRTKKPTNSKPENVNV